MTPSLVLLDREEVFTDASTVMLESTLVKAPIHVQGEEDFSRKER